MRKILFLKIRAKLKLNLPIPNIIHDFPDIRDDIERNLPSITNNFASSDGLTRLDGRDADVLRETETLEGAALEKHAENIPFLF